MEASTELHHIPNWRWWDDFLSGLSRQAGDRITNPLTLHGGNFRQAPLITSLPSEDNPSATSKPQRSKGSSLPFPTSTPSFTSPEYLSVLDPLVAHPTRLNSLTLFQDRAHNPRHGYFPTPYIPGTSTRRALGVRLAKISETARIEHLSVAFLVDAVDFFHQFRHGVSASARLWNNFKTLCLTAHRLNRHESKKKLEAILIRRGRAASLMPALESMAIWNAADDEFLCLVYERERPRPFGGAILTLCSSWFRFIRVEEPESFAAAVDGVLKCLLEGIEIAHPVTGHQMKGEGTVLHPEVMQRLEEEGDGGMEGA
ncbi:hypothetical protein B0T14DRAFT_495323 [Immersiella caudata]|uniref:DUF6546 domain-containing protein n=1 Tax=Immersiella caudata TaxID=314043 RepID=A0AA40C4G0_9PEZI|nr:hypothetical protein B0T14DRAFT_495323 [Immersiella caudata]